MLDPLRMSLSIHDSSYNLVLEYTFPSDEMCPACFAPLPGRAGYNNAALEGSFHMASLPQESQSFDPVNTDTPAIPISGATEPWQSDRLVSSNLRSPESSRGNSQISRNSLRSRTPTQDNSPPDLEDKSIQSNARVCGKKRKLPDQRKKTTKKRKTMIQKPSEHIKVNPQQSKRQSSWESVCWRCQRPVSNYPPPNLGSGKKCRHRQCSGCRISYPEPGFWGRGAWTCCRCNDGPKPTPPLPQICGSEHIWHPDPEPLLPLCHCCLP